MTAYGSSRKMAGCPMHHAGERSVENFETKPVLLQFCRSSNNATNPAANPTPRDIFLAKAPWCCAGGHHQHTYTLTRGLPFFIRRPLLSLMPQEQGGPIGVYPDNSMLDTSFIQLFSSALPPPTRLFVLDPNQTKRDNTWAAFVTSD